MEIPIAGHMDNPTSSMLRSHTSSVDDGSNESRHKYDACYSNEMIDIAV